MQHEKESYSEAPSLKEGPPAPFKVEDKSGAAEMVLRRSFEGEDIEVRAPIEQEPVDDEDAAAEAEPQATEDDQGQVEPPQAFEVTVTISKGGDKPPLVFELLLRDAQWYVGQVKYATLPETAGVRPYEGPDFATLDMELQQQFEEYLFRRGIDVDLASFLQEALLDKEQKEYTRWLGNVANFVSSKA